MGSIDLSLACPPLPDTTLRDIRDRVGEGGGEREKQKEGGVRGNV